MSSQAPKWPLRFLRWFCREDYLDEIEGDLIELFEKRAQKAPTKARWRFAWDVSRSFRPVNFKKLKVNMFSKGIVTHTVLTGFRQMRRNKVFTGINVMGLTLSLVAFFLIGLFVFDELSYDRFHSQYQSIYRVLKTDSLETEKWAYNPPAVAPSLKEDYPEVVDFTRVFFMTDAEVFYGTENLNLSKGFLVDPSFFTMFDFEVVAGTKGLLLTERSNIVISKKVADTYFSSSNPIGESLKFGDREFVVSGVVSVPENSHLDFDYVLDIKARFDEETLGIWRQSFLYSYIHVQPNADIAALQSKSWDQFWKYEKTNKGIKLLLQPLANIHLDPDVNGQFSMSGNRIYVNLFIAAGVILLVIAAINFVNLTIGRTIHRYREMGIRKVVGANRTIVHTHFFGETLIIVMLSFVLAAVVSSQLLPVFNAVTGKGFTISGLLSRLPVMKVTMLLILVPALITLLTAYFPSILVARKSSIQLMQKQGSSLPFKNFLGKASNVFQFAISIILIIGSVVVVRQLDFIQTKDLGWSKNNLVAFPVKSGMFESYKALKGELEQHSAIEGITWVSELPIDVRTGGSIKFEGMNPEKQYVAYYMNGDENLYEIFRLKPDTNFPFRELHDESKSNYVINTSLLKYLREEWGPEVSPIGKELDGGVIVGVVEDYHWQPLTHEIGPLLFGVDAKDNYGRPNWFVARIKDGQLMQGMESLEVSFAKVYPTMTFDYEFVDQKIEKMYKAEQNTSRLLTSFSILAVFISCLGLFGLASQSASSKLKMMSIRKIMGATPLQLFLHFVREFGLILGISIVVAIPASLYVSRQWLSSFAYRIDVNWAIVMVPLLLVCMIVIITLLLQFRVILLANPARTLRDE